MKKIYVFKEKGGRVLLHADKFAFSEYDDDRTYFGEIEIQEPKKTVVKEVPQKQIYERNVYQNNADFLITVPRNAKNLKCTYEVEE